MISHCTSKAVSFRQVVKFTQILAIPFTFQVPGSSAFGLQSQSRTLVYAPSTSPLAFLPGFLKCFWYITLNNGLLRLLLQEVEEMGDFQPRPDAVLLPPNTDTVTFKTFFELSHEECVGNNKKGFDYCRELWCNNNDCSIEAVTYEDFLAGVGTGS